MIQVHSWRPLFIRGGMNIFASLRGKIQLIEKRGWKYSRGVNLFKSGIDTFLDQVSQGYHFYHRKYNKKLKHC